MISYGFVLIPSPLPPKIVELADDQAFGTDTMGMMQATNTQPYNTSTLSFTVSIIERGLLKRSLVCSCLQLSLDSENNQAGGSERQWHELHERVSVATGNFWLSPALGH
jgi:hypothetical protein